MEPPEYQDGWDAHMAGLPITCNPHKWGTEKQFTWARGWKAAKASQRGREIVRSANEEDEQDIPF